MKSFCFCILMVKQIFFATFSTVNVSASAWNSVWNCKNCTQNRKIPHHWKCCAGFSPPSLKFFLWLSWLDDNMDESLMELLMTHCSALTDHNFNEEEQKFFSSLILQSQIFSAPLPYFCHCQWIQLRCTSIWPFLFVMQMMFISTEHFS